MQNPPYFDCIDIFRYGKVDRLAPEAPVPVINPETETTTPGMAGNVVRNIEALGHQVDFITNMGAFLSFYRKTTIAFAISACLPWISFLFVKLGS